MPWGRKDGFPGADGSTITQATGANENASTLTIYGVDGSTELTEDKGFQVESITVAENGLSNTLVYSIKHPLTYITSPNQTPWDWYTSNSLNQNNILWNSPETGKGINDPCPAGWKVAPDGTWIDFLEQANYYIEGVQTSSGNSTQTNGVLYNHSSWYPASGRREFTTGILSYVGNSSFSWSCTNSGVSAKNIYLYMGGSLLSTSFGRSNGFSVRCIQE